MTAIAEKTADVLQEISKEAKNISSIIEAATKKVEDGQINTSKGISFLEVKYEMLLSYLINLTHLMYQKVAGGSIQGSPDVWRLVEIRTVLEKMRPIEHKLKYQIDKLVQLAVTGSLAQNDPLSFKPNPQGLVSKLEESESESGSDDETRADSEPKKYVPPKLAPVHYDGDLTQKDRQQVKLERAKKRALSSSIMEDLRREYGEAPDEFQDSAYSSRRLKREMKERDNYEEDHFVRLSLPKKTKIDLRRQRGESSLDKLTSFGDISVLDKDQYDPTEGKKSKKGGSKRKAKGGRKKSKKRGRFGH